MASIRRVIGLASVLFILSACGGGSSGSGDSGGQTPPPSTQTYSVGTSVAGSGSGSISPTSQTVSQGSTTSFTISPASDSTIAGVSGCGGSLSGSTYTTGAISSSCTVTATFDLSAYTVTASAGTGGSISPGSVSVSHGSTTSFTVTPNSGYQINSVSGCGGSLSGSTYTTGAVTASCTVSAEFSMATPPQVSLGPIPSLWESECGALEASVENPEIVTSYSWRQTLGPEATIQSPGEMSTLFNAPVVSEVTRIEFALTVMTVEGLDYEFLLGTDVFPLQEISGSLFESTSLEGAYKITSDLSVASGVTLTLLPGTVLKFGRSLLVAGTLVAEGTTDNPIFLSSLGACADPSDSVAQWWNGVRFSNSSDSVLSNVVIERSFGIALEGNSPLSLTGSVVRNNFHIITDPQGYQPVTIVGNTFSNNINDMDLRVIGSSLISQNEFSGFINPIFSTASYYFDETVIRENNFLDPPEFEFIRNSEGEYVPTDRPYVILYGPEEGYGFGTVSATDNWWGTTDRDRIASMIFDRDNDVTLQEVPFEPIAESPFETAGSGIAVDIPLPRPQ